MREVPVDSMILATALIYTHNVPLQLICKDDERAVQLISRTNRTKNIRVTKCIRKLGMGKNKAQIATTTFVTKCNDDLPHQ